MTSARFQFAGLAALEAIAGQCRRCGQPWRAHLHYRDTPSNAWACSRYRRPRRKIIFWRTHA